MAIPLTPKDISPYNIFGINDTRVTLSLQVGHPDEENMVVSFYDGDHNLLGTENVSHGAYAQYLWPKLEYGESYEWYAVITEDVPDPDSLTTDTFNFSTYMPDLTATLKSYYPLNGNGNDVHGVHNAAAPPSWADGVIGQCYHVAEAGNYINTRMSGLQDSWGIMFWWKPDFATRDETVIVDKTDGTGKGFRLVADPTIDKLRLEAGSGSINCGYSYDWQFVCIAKDASNGFYLYVGEELRASGGLGWMGDSDVYLKFGVNQSFEFVNPQYFDEISVWSEAPSLSLIKTLHRNGMGLTYPFDLNAKGKDLTYPTLNQTYPPFNAISLVNIDFRFTMQYNGANPDNGVDVELRFSNSVDFSDYDDKQWDGNFTDGEQATTFLSSWDLWDHFYHPDQQNFTVYYYFVLTWQDGGNAYETEQWDTGSGNSVPYSLSLEPNGDIEVPSDNANDTFGFSVDATDICTFTFTPNDHPNNRSNYQQKAPVKVKIIINNHDGDYVGGFDWGDPYTRGEEVTWESVLLPGDYWAALVIKNVGGLKLTDIDFSVGVGLQPFINHASAYTYPVHKIGHIVDPTLKVYAEAPWGNLLNIDGNFYKIAEDTVSNPQRPILIGSDSGTDTLSISSDCNKHGETYEWFVTLKSDGWGGAGPQIGPDTDYEEVDYVQKEFDVYGEDVDLSHGQAPFSESLQGSDTVDLGVGLPSGIDDVSCGALVYINETGNNNGNSHIYYNFDGHDFPQGDYYFRTKFWLGTAEEFPIADIGCGVEVHYEDSSYDSFGFGNINPQILGEWQTVGVHFRVHRDDVSKIRIYPIHSHRCAIGDFYAADTELYWKEDWLSCKGLTSSFEEGVVGDWGSWFNQNCSIEVSDEKSHSGLHSVKFVPVPNHAHKKALAVTLGNVPTGVYYLSSWVYLTGANDKVGVGLGVDQNYSGFYNVDETTTGEWQLVEAVLDTRKSTTSHEVDLKVYAGHISTGGETNPNWDTDFYIDDVTLIRIRPLEFTVNELPNRETPSLILPVDDGEEVDLPTVFKLSFNTQPLEDPEGDTMLATFYIEADDDDIPHTFEATAEYDDNFHFFETSEQDLHPNTDYKWYAEISDDSGATGVLRYPDPGSNDLYYRFSTEDALESYKIQGQEYNYPSGYATLPAHNLSRVEFESKWNFDVLEENLYYKNYLVYDSNEDLMHEGGDPCNNWTSPFNHELPEDGRDFIWRIKVYEDADESNLLAIRDIGFAVPEGVAPGIPSMTIPPHTNHNPDSYFDTPDDVKIEGLTCSDDDCGDNGGTIMVHIKLRKWSFDGSQVQIIGDEITREIESGESIDISNNNLENDLGISFKENTKYRFEVWGVDAQGNEGEHSDTGHYIFYVKNQAPEITSFSPANAATGVAINTSLELSIHDDDKGQVEVKLYYGNVHSGPYNLPVTQIVHLDDNGNATFTYIPNTGIWTEDETYYWYALVTSPSCDTEDTVMSAKTTRKPASSDYSFTTIDDQLPVVQTGAENWNPTSALGIDVNQKVNLSVVIKDTAGPSSGDVKFYIYTDNNPANATNTLVGNIPYDIGQNVEEIITLAANNWVFGVNLAHGTKYYWCVKVEEDDIASSAFYYYYDAAGEEQPYFETVSAGNLDFTNMTPNWTLNGYDGKYKSDITEITFQANIEDPNPSATFSKVEIYLDEENNPAWTDNEPPADNEYTLNAEISGTNLETAGGSHEWKIKATTSHNTETSGNKKYYINKPAFVEQLDPEDGAEYTTSPVNISFHIKDDDTGEEDSIVAKLQKKVGDNWVTVSNGTFSNNSPNAYIDHEWNCGIGGFEWRIKLHDDYDVSYSDERTLTVDPGSIVISGIDPEEDDVVPSGVHTFSANINHSLPVNVKFKIKDDDSSFTIMNSWNNESPGNFTFGYRIYGNRDYIWKVEAEDQEGNSATSGGKTFSVTGNNPYVIGEPTPINGAVGVSREPTLRVQCFNPEKPYADSITVQFKDGNGAYIGNGQSIPNNSVASCVWTSANAYGELYDWKVSIDDVDCSSYSFTIIENQPPEPVTLISPILHATEQGTTVGLKVKTETDPESEDVTLKFMEYGGGMIGNEINNVGQNVECTQEWANLSPHTTYKWYVKVIDTYGNETISPADGEYWDFTTANHNPDDPSDGMTPNDSVVVNQVPPQLSITEIVDPDGDSMDVRFYAQTDTSQGAFELVHVAERVSSGSPVNWVWDEDLTPGETYGWYVVLEDEYGGRTISASKYFKIPSLPTCEFLGVEDETINLPVGESVTLGVKPTHDEADDMEVAIYNYDTQEIIESWDEVTNNQTLTYNMTDLTQCQTIKWYVKIIVYIDNNMINSKTFPDNIKGYREFRMNCMPEAPYNINPEDESETVWNSGTGDYVNVDLSIYVSDQDGDSLDTVKFYNYETDELIGTVEDASIDDAIGKTWNNLSRGETYKWYIKITDGNLTRYAPVKNGIESYWEFTTTHLPTMTAKETVYPNPNAVEIQPSVSLQATMEHPDEIDFSEIKLIDATDEGDIKNFSNKPSGFVASEKWDEANELGEPYYWYIKATDEHGGIMVSPVFLFIVRDKIKTISDANQYSIYGLHNISLGNINQLGGDLQKKYVSDLEDALAGYYPLNINGAPEMGNDVLDANGNFSHEGVSDNCLTGYAKYTGDALEGVEWTVNTWWSAKDIGSGDELILAARNADNLTNNWRIRVTATDSDDGLKIEFIDDDGGITVINTKDRIWNMLTLAYEDETLYLYHNSAKMVEISCSLSSITADLKIGNSTNTRLDETRIYTRRINHLEVGELYIEHANSNSIGIRDFGDQATGGGGEVPNT